MSKEAINDGINKKAAEILVECGYCDDYGEVVDFPVNRFWTSFDGKPINNVNINPFSDTLEGRRQADAIEDWLDSHKYNLWSQSQRTVPGISAQSINRHQWRLDRIKWCLEELSK